MFNRKPKAQGFTLIELMIVVSIIGILAAVALPAYRDYTVRSKVSELLFAASSGRTAISEQAAHLGAMPDTATGVVNDQQSTYVASVTYTGIDATTGVITATASPREAAIAGSTITLTGTYAAATGQVGWVCGGTIDQRYRPASCR